MRIVGGVAKGRKLKSLSEKPGLRPLSEQVREALFNVLAERVTESYFLDLFAGTGAVGLEALSRGATRAFFVEQDKATARVIQQNLALLGYQEKSEVFVLDVLQALGIFERRKAQFDLVFIGAPYSQSELLIKVLAVLGKGAVLNANSIVVAESHKKTKLEENYGALKLVKVKNYGDTVLTFYKE
ncbi:MAG: 16S rRNA (guanine(966)-N(2))-methyltransferase RsmD [Candidatus Saganbacteria bacterium]|nr:16S rRNA (guanine(966)-N(2))-methyltransferase RsmD [Candidatus Saganbacteria bacterium]